ncbi:uncharacterized protein LOC126821251 [Patella vulgata]|uniref:uncharacterized protein LOC126821251 n=1 Tax=Patella vulgata TaxID=6465 RepID=UPI00217F263F|nr:uncharacterized protein LOC126821251 [Patella vulgata]
MADNEEENGMITIATDPLSSDSVIVTGPEDDRVIHDDDAEDILQQAIQDAQEFGEEAVTLSYVTAEEGEHDPTIVAQEITNNVNVNVVSDTDSALATTVVGTTADNGIAYDISYAVVSDMDHQTENMTLEENIEAVMMAPDSQIEQVAVQQLQPTENIITMQSSDFTNSVPQGGINVTLVPSNQNSVAPIGSSQNPIRIVQQGNQYTPVQQLTAEQLQQIMHVVQEQQLAKSADSTSGSSILYNPATNTRIVYRVIYPSELHKTTGITTPEKSSSANSTGPESSSIQRKNYKKRTREDEEDKVDGPEMSKEEKEERKKHRPRTRSGRVSKPPKHMVKDYKHIHVLDWDEDYDDSDGGYSDFKISDEDKEKAENSNANNTNSNNRKETDSSPDFIDASSGLERVKNYKCEGCDKAYIGHGGLRRHYQLNPSHGTITEESDIDKVSVPVPLPVVATPETAETQSTVSSNNLPTNGSIGSISEDSNTQDSIPSQVTPTSIPSTTSYYKPRGRGRGRPAQSLDIPSKRRAKLQDLVRLCTDDELMEIVLPRLANVITLWEFLMMKVEKGGKALPKVDDIVHEFETLQKQVAKTCQECLMPLNESKDVTESQAHNIQVVDEVMAACLGLKVGKYQAKSLPKEEKSFHYKYLTTERLGIPAKRQGNRRTIEIVTPDELIQSNNKKPRMTTLLNNTIVSMTNKRSLSSPVTTSTPPSSSTPISILTTPISSSRSATPMQIVVNNHNNLLSESAQMPITTQTISTAISNNGILHSENHQTVLLTNSVPLSTAFATLNGGSVLNINGNNSVLQSTPTITTSSATIIPTAVTKNNGTVVNGNNINSILVNNNPNVKIETSHSDIVQEVPVPNFVNPIESNSQQTSVKSGLINSKIADVNDEGLVTVDQTETIDLQVPLNGIQEGTADVLQGEIINPSENAYFSAEQIEGEIISPDQIVTQASNIFQTEDGTLIIQNPDGTTFQLQGAEGIPLETVQALLAMESEGHFVEQEQLQTEMQ